MTIFAKFELWFSASSLVVKIATFAKPETVIRHALEETTHLKQPN
jgi:hypothetical protein